MKKGLLFLFGLLVVGLFISGCTQVTPVDTTPVYNSTLNEELEELTNPNASNTTLTPASFKPTLRPEAEYEFATEDVFGKTGSNFNSSKASVLGIMLGDSYERVINTLGIPDVRYTAGDKSYSNLEYGKKIGIDDLVTPITYHIEGDKVTRITMRQSFSAYLRGNTSFGIKSADFYSIMDVPDYMSFLEAHRSFNYVENGLEVYFKRDKVDIISIVPPKQFKGVEYKTVPVEIAPGIMGNVTKAFPIE